MDAATLKITSAHLTMVRQTLSTGLQRVIKHDFCQRVIKHNYGSSLKQLINRGGSGGRSSKKTSATAQRVSMGKRGPTIGRCGVESTVRLKGAFVSMPLRRVGICRPQCVVQNWTV